MTFETKEQVLEKVLSQEKPICPYCSTEMRLWEVPPINFSDGLGWGVPYLYLCFNDNCSLYEEGWDNLRENYAQNASYRCICYPGTTQFECMPVFSPIGAKGQIIDDQALATEKRLKEAVKRGVSMLTDCYVAKDPMPILEMLLDATQPISVRVKAAEMTGDIGELEAIEPIRNLKFSNEILKKAAEEGVNKMHDRYFTRECPFCAEIIKKRAKICKHCGKDVAGQ
jgi:RNA polymerase subunit RPABC4/transcription elongation factor Spt4